MRSPLGTGESNTSEWKGIGEKQNKNGKIYIRLHGKFVTEVKEDRNSFRSFVIYNFTNEVRKNFVEKFLVPFNDESLRIIFTNFWSI